jgi:hypothetical protein
MPATEVDLRDCRQFFPRKVQNPIGNSRLIVFRNEPSPEDGMEMISGVVR